MVAGEPRLTDSPPPTTSLATAEGTGLSKFSPSQAWTDPGWQQLWLTLDRMPWRTLALIPAGDGAPSDFSLTMAVTLSRTGMSHVGAPILVADGRQVPLNQLNAFLADVRTCRDEGERVIIALSPPGENPTTVAMGKAADAAVLCVMLDRMHSSDAHKTIKLIGASKFLGSVIIRPDDARPVR